MEAAIESYVKQSARSLMEYRQVRLLVVEDSERAKKKKGLTPGGKITIERRLMDELERLRVEYREAGIKDLKRFLKEQRGAYDHDRCRLAMMKRVEKLPQWDVRIPKLYSLLDKETSKTRLVRNMVAVMAALYDLRLCEVGFSECGCTP
jgi:hypothetical protein